MEGRGGLGVDAIVIYDIRAHERVCRRVGKREQGMRLIALQHQLETLNVLLERL